MSNKPTRAYSLTLNIGADTLQDLTYCLNDIVIDLSKGELPAGTGVAASVAFGYSYQYHLDETMTHERYMDQLSRYLESEDRHGEQAQDEKE